MATPPQASVLNYTYQSVPSQAPSVINPTDWHSYIATDFVDIPIAIYFFLSLLTSYLYPYTM